MTKIIYLSEFLDEKRMIIDEIIFLPVKLLFLTLRSCMHDTWHLSKSVEVDSIKIEYMQIWKQ